MNAYMLSVGAFAIIIIFCLRPAWAVYALVLLLPLEGALISQDGHLSLTRVVQACAVVSVLFRSLLEKSALWNDYMIYKVIGLWLWLCIVYVIVVNKNGSIKDVLPVTTAVLVFITIYISRRLLKMKWVTRSFSLGAIVPSIAVIENYYQGLSFSVVESVGLETLRYTAFGRTDPDIVGSYLGLAFLLLLAQTSAKWSIYRIAEIAGSAIVLVALLLTGMRAATIGLLVAAATLFLLRQLCLRRLVVIVLTFGSIIALWVAVQSSTWQSRAVIGESDVVSRSVVRMTEPDGYRTNPRLAIWHVGLILLGDNWLHGVGLNRFHLQYNQYAAVVRHGFAAGFGRAAHNIWLLVASEGGIVAFMLLLGIVTSACRRSIGLVRYSRIGSGLAIILYALIFSMFNDALYYKAFWAAMALSAGMAEMSDVQFPIMTWEKKIKYSYNFCSSFLFQSNKQAHAKAGRKI